MRLIATHPSSGTYYVLLQVIFIILVLIFGYKKFKPKKSYFLLSLFIAGSFQINIPPIQENDQFRYFWEGKVASQLKNPYKLSPSNQELDFIDFPERNLISYNKLTSIYPPLSIAFWSSFSSFNYKEMLQINQVIFLFLYLIFCSLLLKQHENYFFVSLSSLAFIKEFIQSVHIDLLAGFFFLLFFIQFKNKNLISSLSSLAAQVLTKLLGILIFPFILLREKKSNYFLILIYAIIPILIYAYLALTNSSNGPEAFITSWKWNSLTYEVLLSLGLEHITIKLIIRSFFFATYLATLYLFWKRKISFLKSIALVFALLFFFSHVYNAWYGIYLFIPAYLLGNLGFILYSLSGLFGYLLYDYNYEMSIAFITHLFFLWGCFEMINNKDTLNIEF